MKALADQFVELGVVFPQLSAHPGNQASAFIYKFLPHAREFPKLYNARLRCREPAEVTYIRAKRRSKHVRVAAARRIRVSTVHKLLKRHRIRRIDAEGVLDILRSEEIKLP